MSKYNYSLTLKDPDGVSGADSLKRALELARQFGRATEIVPQTARAESAIFTKYGCDYLVVIGEAIIKRTA